MPVAGRGGVPAGAVAATLNVAVVSPVEAGFLSLHPCDGVVPNASTLNFAAGQTVANGATVPLGVAADGTPGTVCITSSADTHVIVDVNGAYPAP